jgi:hypothetical protein
MLALSQQRIVGEKASCETWRFLFAEPDFAFYFCSPSGGEPRRGGGQRRFRNRIRTELFASVEKTPQPSSLN